jgi:two-component system, sensor histidine kinase and response regulator
VDLTSYAAVLMDCQMPGMNGFEAARAIRERQNGGRRTALIAVSASATSAEIDASLEAGMDACLTKPFSTAQLGEALARMLPPHGSPDARIDHSALDRLRADVGDDAAVTKIARMFVAGLPEVRAELASALERGEADGLRRGAHRLRSSSAVFGAVRLEQLCAELEEVADDDLESAAAVVARIESESTRVADELGAELARYPSSR